MFTYLLGQILLHKETQFFLIVFKYICLSAHTPYKVFK